MLAIKNTATFPFSVRALGGSVHGFACFALEQVGLLQGADRVLPAPLLPPGQEYYYSTDQGA